MSFFCALCVCAATCSRAWFLPPASRTEEEEAAEEDRAHQQRPAEGARPKVGTLLHHSDSLVKSSWECFSHKPSRVNFDLLTGNKDMIVTPSSHKQQFHTTTKPFEWAHYLNTFNPFLRVFDLSDALEKMKGVYEQNPQMGDPSSLEPQITETSQKISQLRGELVKYEVKTHTAQTYMKTL